MKDITVEELKKRRDAGEEIIVIDVRETWEFEEFNIGGRLMPLGELQGMIDDIDDLSDNEIVVHCRSGARSAAAKDFMIRQGFTNVRNLLGGVLAWQDMIGV